LTRCNKRQGDAEACALARRTVDSNAATEHGGDGIPDDMQAEAAAAASELAGDEGVEDAAEQFRRMPRAVGPVRQTVTRRRLP
jgi:hypothetical protein